VPGEPASVQGGGPGVPGQQAPQQPNQSPHVPHPHQASDAPDIAEVYGQLKLPDEMLGGVYATGAMIRHTPTEFAIDFITNFYPRAVVTARIFLAAGRMRSFVDTFQNSLARYRQGQGGPPNPPPGTTTTY